MELKKPATYDQQIQKLISRGCIINDYNFAYEVLQKVNYYRLTAYFLPFLDELNGKVYKDGTTFEKVYYIHEFDKKLRNLIFIIIEDIELALRIQLSYYHAHKYGESGYKNPSNFNKKHNTARFKSNIKKMIKNNEGQTFVKHHIEKYNAEFPIWVIIELFSLGDLSIFYCDMLVNDQKVIAEKLFNANYHCVKSWLLCITHLRNYCAHYSMLYYNTFPATPKTPNNINYSLDNKIFDYILVLKYLYKNIGNWNTSFITPFTALTDEYSEYINFNHMSFPDNWYDLIIN